MSSTQRCELSLPWLVLQLLRLMLWLRRLILFWLLHLVFRTPPRPLLGGPRHGGPAEADRAMAACCERRALHLTAEGSH